MMLAASVWLGFNRGRSWSCDQCKAKRGLRELRGNCGGPFREGLPLAQRDERGLYVPGYRVAPDSGEEFSDMLVRSCPVAGANRLASIISAYQRHRSGLYSIHTSHPSPSCALVEAVDVLHYHTEAAHNRAHKRAIEEARHG